MTRRPRKQAKGKADAADDAKTATAAEKPANAEVVANSAPLSQAASGQQPGKAQTGQGQKEAVSNAATGEGTTNADARGGAAGAPDVAGEAIAGAQMASGVPAGSAVAPEGGAGGEAGGPAPVRGDDAAQQVGETGEGQKEAVTHGQGEGGAPDGGNDGGRDRQEGNGDPAQKAQGGYEPASDITEAELAVIAADMIAQISQIVLMDGPSPADRLSLLGSNVEALGAVTGTIDMEETEIAAAFIRDNPTAPAEAVVIHLRRAGIDVPEWAATRANIQSSHEVFKLMLTLLDAKLAAMAPAAPEQAPLPPSKPARLGRKRR